VRFPTAGGLGTLRALGAGAFPTTGGLRRWWALMGVPFPTTDAKRYGRTPWTRAFAVRGRKVHVQAHALRPSATVEHGAQADERHRDRRKQERGADDGADCDVVRPTLGADDGDDRDQRLG